MYNVFLVPCTSSNGKPIFKYIYLPKLVSSEHLWNTSRRNTLLAEVCSQYKLYIIFSSYVFFFSLTFYRENNIFLALVKIIVDVTIAPLSIDWLAYFWRWTTLIGSFESNIKTSTNIFNSLQLFLTASVNYNTMFGMFKDNVVICKELLNLQAT